MFTVMFRTQWRWTSLAVLGIALLAFIFPSLAWRLAQEAGSPNSVAQILDGFTALSPMLGFLALLGPFVIAALPWTIDHETRHVYALSLPIRWQQFLAYRFAIGAITLLLPALALYVGSVAALAQVELPALLHGYPGLLALRFLLACWLAYSLSFALQYLAGRRATLVAVLFVLAVAVITVSAMLLGKSVQLERAVGLLFRWPGPLAIFVEQWTLIDV